MSLAISLLSAESSALLIDCDDASGLGVWATVLGRFRFRSANKSVSASPRFEALSSSTCRRTWGFSVTVIPVWPRSELENLPLC